MYELEVTEAEDNTQNPACTKELTGVFTNLLHTVSLLFYLNNFQAFIYIFHLSEYFTYMNQNKNHNYVHGGSNN